MFKDNKNKVYLTLIVFLVFVIFYTNAFSNHLYPFWQWINPVPTGENLNKVVFTKDKYWAVGNCGTIVSSNDGKVWDSKKSEVTFNLTSIAYKDNLLLVVGEEGTVVRSADGENWNKVEFPSKAYLSDISVLNGYFVVIGNGISEGGSIFYSQDGVLWGISVHSTPPTKNYNFISLSAIGDRLYAVGSCDYYDSASGEWKHPSIIATTGDGLNWETKEYEFTPFIYSISGNGEIFLCSGIDPESYECRFFISDHLISWEKVSTALEGTIANTIIFDGSNFFAVTSTNPFTFSSFEENCVLKSSDGRNWQTVFEGMHDEFRGICKGDSGFVVAGNYGIILQSSDGELWSIPTPSIYLYGWLRGVSYSGEKYVAVGTELGNYGWLPVIFESDDGITWRKAIIPDGAFGGLEKIVWSEHFKRFLAVGSSLLLSSENGVEWKILNIPKLYDYNDIACNGNLCIATGQVGDYPAFQFTNDGYNWTIKKLDKRGKVHSITYGNGVWMAVGQKLNGKLRIWQSPDGVKWKHIPIPSRNMKGQTAQIAFGVSSFIISTEGDYFLKSASGKEWDLVSKPYELNSLVIPTISYAKDKFIGLAQGFGAHFISSIDAVNWDVSEAISNLYILDIIYNGTSYIVVGDGGAILVGK